MRYIKIIAGTLALAWGTQPQYAPEFTENALGHRLCFTHSIGFDYLEAGLSRIVDENIQVYEKPSDFEFLAQLQTGFGRDQKREPKAIFERRGPGKVVHEDHGDKQLIRLKYPIRFQSTTTSPLAYGIIEFGAALQVSFEGSSPKFSLVASETSASEDFVCKGKDADCEAYKKFVETQLAKEVLTFLDEKMDYFAQPTSARIIMGMIDYYSLFGARSIETVHSFVQKHALIVFFNCKKEQVAKISTKAVPRDRQEFGFSQNLLDNVFQPHEISYSIDEALNHRLVQALIKQNPIVQDKIGMIPRGIIRFSKDPVTMAAMDFSKIQEPGISNKTAAKESKYNPGTMMDLIEINQNILVEITDEKSDLTMIPAQLNLAFLAKTREGHKLRYGVTEEFKFEFVSALVNALEPQHISRELQMHEYGRPYPIEQGSGASDEDDEDEFDDEDEEEDEGEKDKSSLKPSNLGLLLQSTRNIILDQGKELVEGLLEGAFRVQHDGMKTGFFAKNMEYYPINVKYAHELEFCTGMESKEPWYWVDDDRLVMTMEFNKGQIPSTEFCNSKYFLEKMDPTPFTDKGSKPSMAVLSDISRFDQFNELIDAQGYTFRLKTMSTDSGYFLFQNSVNTMLNYFSNFAFFSRRCEEYWGNVSDVASPMFHLNCPLYFTKELYPGEEFRTHFKTMERTLYFDFDSIQTSYFIETLIYGASYASIAIGLLLHFKKIRLPVPTLYLIVGGGNLLLSLPNWADQSRRFGIDYIAYLQQAGAAFHGERNYTQISSTLGPCFYPAGHLWHYYPVYWLHSQTELAEKIMTLIFMLIHTSLIVLAVAIAQEYFGSLKVSAKSGKAATYAQLIGFMMLANQRERTAFMELFNDEVMMLYVVLAIYLMVKNQPLQAALFVSLGFSVKAGVMLFLPAFLGSIQYFHGTFKLVAALAILIGIQVLVAWPFISSGKTSVSEYLAFSQLTGGGRGGEFYTDEKWKYIAADQTLSIFFTFLPEDMYLNPNLFSTPLKVLMLLGNIFHFFIKHNAFPRCFSNLLSPFTSQKVLEVEKPKLIEILVLGYILGLVLMPGAHDQFQYWFVSLVPLMLSMLPIPYEYTFWICLVLYPIRRELDPMWQHLFLLGMVGTLLLRPTPKPVKIKAK